MPPKPAPTALDIARAGTAQPDTPERRRFAKLLGQIEAARQRLADWQQGLPAFATAYEAQVTPMQQRMAQARRAWAFELEQRLLQGRWSRAEQQTFSRMIAELAAADLDDDAATDPELLALHDRHAEVDRASAQQQEVQAMKALLERMSGLDLGDDDAASPEELLRRARERMAQQRDEAEAHAAAHPPPRQRPRKATKAEQRAAEDARLATQSVRDVYRKLAAALHPDRAEPDATPEQRERRHEQMSRANAAYEAGDLLALLTLQLQIEQVDIAHAATVAAGQVRHFNKVLSEQLQELEAEIAHREHTFLQTYHLPAANRPHPNKLGLFLKDAVRQMLAAEASLARAQRALRGDQATVRRFLKDIAAEYRAEDARGGFGPF